MRAIADAAGVAVPTVELAFASKPRLLKAAIDVAIAGDDQPLPMLERDWAARALAATTAADLLPVVGAVVRESMIRSAPLVVAAFELAATGPAMRSVADELTRQRAITAGWLVDALGARAPLRKGLGRDLAIDTVWLLMDPVVFQRLTRERGWTPAQYERWFTESVARLVLEVGAEPGQPGVCADHHGRQGDQHAEAHRHRGNNGQHEPAPAGRKPKHPPADARDR